MPFDLDVMDADWRSQLSDEQLDALERRQPAVGPSGPVARISRVTAQGDGSRRAEPINRAHDAPGSERSGWFAGWAERFLGGDRRVD